MKTLVYLVAFLAAMRFTASTTLAQVPESYSAQEELTETDQIVNKVSPTQAVLKQTRAFLEVFQREQGRWPESWTEVEQKFDVPIWESPDIRQSFTRSFVLLQGIDGQIETREEGEYDATMMMVMAEPIERNVSREKSELGRWAVWKTFRGQIVTRWHPETEIVSLSTWPEVQSVIARHINAVDKVDKPSQDLPPRKPSPVVPQAELKQVPEAKPTSTLSKEPASSTPWSVIVILIVAAIGLLLLLLKGRK